VRFYVELDVASTTYVHCDVTVEADAVVAVYHTVVAFDTLDEIPPTRRHGDSATSPVCGDADTRAVAGSRLQHPVVTMPMRGRHQRAGSSIGSRSMPCTNRLPSP
jgi:hypothetical protein